MNTLFSQESEFAIPAFVISCDHFEEFCETLDDQRSAWVHENAFSANFGQALMCPNSEGKFDCALLGIGSVEDRKNSRFCLAGAAQ